MAPSRMDQSKKWARVKNPYYDPHHVDHFNLFRCPLHFQDKWSSHGHGQRSSLEKYLSCRSEFLMWIIYLKSYRNEFGFKKNLATCNSALNKKRGVITNWWEEIYQPFISYIMNVHWTATNFWTCKKTLFKKLQIQKTALDINNFDIC